MEVRSGLLARQMERWRLGLDYWPDRDGEKVRSGLLARQRWRDEG